MPGTSKSSNFELDQPEFCSYGREPIAALLIRHGALLIAKITCRYRSGLKIKLLEVDRARWYGITKLPSLESQSI
jgi:hypothetical protein